MAVQSEPEVPVRPEHHKPFGTAAAEVKRLIQPDVFKIPTREDSEEHVLLDRLELRRGENLAAERYRVGDNDGPESQPSVLTAIR